MATTASTPRAAAVRRAIEELPRLRSAAEAAANRARDAAALGDAATKGSHRLEPAEAMAAIGSGITEAERAAALYDSALEHLENYLAEPDRGRDLPT